MPEEIRLWKVENGDVLQECQRASLDLEARIESWLTQDISLLDPELMVIGRQVETDFGGYIDLLCIDRGGDLVIVELKRDKTPREVTAQVLEYATFVQDLSSERITSIADRHLGGDGVFEDAFQRHFGSDLPESLNNSHRMLIVASRIDPSSERIIKYLSDSYGVDLNAVTFQYFKAADGTELIARFFLIEPSQVEYKTRTKGSSKRLPNLTYEELEETAIRNGVGEPYQRIVAGLEGIFSKHTTRSSIVFTGNLDGRRRAILSLIPQDSSPDNGLRFQVYLLRLENYFKLSEADALALLPQDREPWKYTDNAGPDYSGFAGYFLNAEEIDHFLGGLS